MRKKILSATISVLALFMATSCSQEGAHQSDLAAQAEFQRQWDSFVSRFLDGYFALNPGFAVYQGRHDFDGKLPDWSAEGLKAQAGFLKQAIADAKAFDTKQLTKQQVFERDYMLAVAEGQLFWLEDADQPHSNPAYYLGAGLDPNVYITRPYADPETRMRAFIAFARNIPTAAAQIRANLKTPMPASFINYGKAGFEGLASYYVGDAKAAFASVQDQALQGEFDAAAQDASRAMKELAQWIESGRSSATQDYALGADRFQRMLYATERVDTPVSELEKIGWADLRRNQEALKSACENFAPGGSIAQCMAKLSSDKPEGGPVAGARRQLPMLKQFLIDKDIVSIPGEEEALVEESPPYNRQNSAYIDIPGPYEKGLPSVFYISPPDPSWSAAVQQAYIPGEKDLLFTSVHEVWPGHFLNFLHANRAKSLFGKVFVGYAYAEGWAHYAEEMMWDAGLGEGDAETHIGQLSNALLRNCRFVSAIGLHTGTMTQEQSRKLFSEECYQDEGNSRQQAARGTYDPAYLNYTLGKLLIRKLRDDWTAQHGGRKAWKEFHNRFLGYGGPPIPLVRQMMMETKAESVF